MEPVIRIGRWALFEYTALMDAAVLLGLAAFWFLLRRRWSYEVVLEGALSALAGAIPFGRALYVLSNAEYFAERWGEAVRVWKGGLALPGAVLGGILGLWLFARRRGLDFALWLDAATVALTAGQIPGWLAAHTAGRAYGRTWRGFGAMFIPDIYGVRDYRLPVQLAAALWSALVLVVMLLLLRRMPPGGLFTAYAVLYLPADLVLRFLRGDVVPVLGPLEWGQLVDMALIAWGLALWVRRGKIISEEHPPNPQA